jgi:hypothetical protein
MPTPPAAGGRGAQRISRTSQIARFGRSRHAPRVERMKRLVVAPGALKASMSFCRWSCGVLPSSLKKGMPSPSSQSDTAEETQVVSASSVRLRSAGSLGLTDVERNDKLPARNGCQRQSGEQMAGEAARDSRR